VFSRSARNEFPLTQQVSSTTLDAPTARMSRRRSSYSKALTQSLRDGGAAMDAIASTNARSLGFKKRMSGNGLLPGGGNGLLRPMDHGPKKNLGFSNEVAGECALPGLMRGLQRVARADAASSGARDAQVPRGCGDGGLAVGARGFPAIFPANTQQEVVGRGEKLTLVSLDEVWEKLDGDGSGEISLRELVTALARYMFTCGLR